jgi:ferric-dicitrate binding protein FerR (iron transport regulator)
MTRERSDMPARVRRVREASRWFVERESGRELSAVELREWEHWSADADNKAEYDETCLLPAQFRSLPCPPRPSDEELKADLIQVAGGPADESATDATVVNFPKRARPRPNLNRASVAAAAAIPVFAGVVLMIVYGYWPFRWQSEPWQMYSTAAAQHREVTLRDGSVVTLGGDTVLRARVAAHYSRAVILDRGEALYRVKHDTQQPFTVDARNGSIEAIGTVFDVRNYSNRVQVTVTEGVVEVVSSQARDVPMDDSWFSTAKKSASVRVEQGQRVSYRKDGSAGAPQATDLMGATDWTRGSITYNGKPLHEIIEDVQRYYPRRIVLDPAIADLTYTGTFQQKEADAWLRNLSLIFSVEVFDLDANSVVIRPRR